MFRLFSFLLLEWFRFMNVFIFLLPFLVWSMYQNIFWYIARCMVCVGLCWNMLNELCAYWRCDRNEAKEVIKVWKQNGITSASNLMEFPIYNDSDNGSVGCDHFNSSLTRKLISIRKIISSCFSYQFFFLLFIFFWGGFRRPICPLTGTILFKFVAK